MSQTLIDERISYKCSGGDITNVHTSLTKVGEYFTLSHFAYRVDKGKVIDLYEPADIKTTNFNIVYKKYNSYHKMHIDMIEYLNNKNEVK